MRAHVLPAAALLLGVATASCHRDYDTAPPLAATIEAVAWPDTLTETDSTDLAIRISTSTDGSLVATTVQWTSSDPATLEVLRPAASDTSLAARLSAQLRVAVIARRAGKATISATIPGGGQFVSSELQRTVVIGQHWTSISAGYSHTCGTTIRNEAYCWGGGLRLLGNGSSAGAIVPSKVIGGIQFRSVSAGWEQSCGASLDGQLFCWGYNPLGAVGNGTTLDQFAPVAVVFALTFKSFASGFGFTCGISGIDTADCWGDDSAGQLGSLGPRDTCGATHTPCNLLPDTVATKAGPVLTASSISPAERHTCAVGLDKQVYCWGDNTRGNLGTGITTSEMLPTAANSAVAFAAVSAGPYHTCALSTVGRVYCWGTNLFGELGGAPANDTCDGLPCTRTPAEVPGQRGYRAISVRGRSTCAIGADSLAYCWGLDDYGQLGTAAQLTTCAGLPCATTAVAVGSLGKITAISTGLRHACAIGINGAAYCWGQNSDGRLGNGSTKDASRPVRVSDPP